jgi:signal transduction histidine kinase
MEKLHLAVIDFGIGIPASVRSLSENTSLDSAKALEWAFQSGTTTKQDRVSRGLGLNLLQDFITKNHGCLTIFSNDGCVTVDDNGVSYMMGETDFSGTLVNIALQCNEHYYCLASEVPSTEEPLF